MNNIINTKEDIAALSEAERNQFMQSLLGTLWRLEKDDVAKTWVATEDNTTIARFGFTRADFPNAVAPALPIYIDTSPTYQELRATEYNLKSTGEQFGMMFDDQVNGTTTWLDWQTEIKTRIAKI
jgi:hypothetical protein